jgi:predicted Fe-Mo cluster-binding NifX family protein
MKVALAVWKGRISPVFDVSRQVLVLDIENNSVTGATHETIRHDDPVRRVSRLMELDVHTLICGAISQSLVNMLDMRGIGTISFIAGGVDEVIDAYLAGALPNPGLSMPGCCAQRRQRGRCLKNQKQRNSPVQGSSERRRKGG